MEELGTLFVRNGHWRLRSGLVFLEGAIELDDSYDMDFEALYPVTLRCDARNGTLSDNEYKGNIRLKLRGSIAEHVKLAPCGKKLSRK